MKKSVFMFVLALMCLFAFTLPAYALTQPIISYITNGENSMRWDWNSVSEEVYDYNIEIWKDGDPGNKFSATVHGETYYKQENVTSNVVYTAHIKIFNEENWGTDSSQMFIPDPAPIIGDVQPANGEINVSVDKVITFYSSKRIIEDTSNIVLKKGEETVVTNIYYHDTVIRIVPISKLEEGVMYTVYLSGITDLMGQVAEPMSWSFTTVQPLVIASSSSSSSSGDGYVSTTTVIPVIISYTYIDVDNHWAKNSVQILVNKQILPSNALYFYPDNEINREDFVKLLMIGMKYQTSTYAGKFTDVTTDNPNAIYIQTAIDKGIIQGTSATTFDPTKPITREEIFAMFDRTLKLENITPTEIKPLTEFKDYQTISPWAVDSVANIYSLDLVKGKTDIANVIIDPIANTSNAENATLLVRLLGKVGK